MARQGLFWPYVVFWARQDLFGPSSTFLGGSRPVLALSLPLKRLKASFVLVFCGASRPLLALCCFLGASRPLWAFFHFFGRVKACFGLISLFLGLIRPYKMFLRLKACCFGVTTNTPYDGLARQRLFWRICLFWRVKAPSSIIMYFLAASRHSRLYWYYTGFSVERGHQRVKNHGLIHISHSGWKCKDGLGIQLITERSLRSRP